MADPFTQRFLVKAEAPLNSEKVFQDDISTVIKVNYDGNPFFPAELEQERVEDKAKLSAALYQHVWEGSTYDEVDNSIIELAWFEAAIDLADRFKVRPSGSVVCGFDPSDMGGDDSGLVVRHGPVLLELGLKSTGDVSDKLDWAVEATNKHNADVFIYDGDGLGLGLGREVDRQLGHRSTSIQRFHGGEVPDEADAMYDGHRSNRDAFFNRRAQAYWLVRDRFYKSYRMSQGEYVDPDECIFLRSDMPLIDQLRAEVCRIPRKPNAHGKIQIMPKEQMAKEPYCLPSPNLADALVYSFAVTDHLYGEFNKPIEYEMDASYI